MNKIRVIVADDERPAREFLKNILREIDQVELVGEAENGGDAVELIRSVRPDLAILDLNMPEVSGLDAVRSLRKSQMPLVAFVTAYDEFAVQAFEVNAVDYLLKPVERERLLETIRRAGERLEQTDWRQVEAEKLRRTSDTYSAYERSLPLDRIPVRERGSILLIPVGEIASIIADGELLMITTDKRKSYSINYRLKELELRLPGNFVRLSRGSLVNLDHVSRILPMPGGVFEAHLSNGQSITSSRLQARLLRSKLLKL